MVLTARAVFLIEVKNARRDIYIDEVGNYYRVCGNNMFDSNIGEKMNCKERLLREVLGKEGVLPSEKDINIVNLVVFTNSQMSVHNAYPYLQHCFLSHLPHIIDNYNGIELYSTEEMEKMQQVLYDSKCEESYPPEMDMEKFKRDFATVMAVLESMPEVESEETEEGKEEPEKYVGLKNEKSVPETAKRQEAKELPFGKQLLENAAQIAAVAGLAAVVYGVVKHRKVIR